MNAIPLLFAALCLALAAAAALTQIPWRGRHLLAWGALSLALLLMALRELLPLVGVPAGSGEMTVGVLAAAAALVGVVVLKGLCADLDRRALRVADQERELARLARNDALTGVLNRRELLLRAEAEIERGRRYRHTTGLVLFDLDHFRELNERFGHEIGDEVLRAFCGVALETARSNDHLGRMGSEEFALLLPETDAEHAELVAERIRAKAAALRLEHAGRPVLFTVSAGIANADPAGAFEAAAALLRRAGLALAAAKRQGRNRVESYREPLEQPPPAIRPVTPADPRKLDAAFDTDRDD